MRFFSNFYNRTEEVVLPVSRISHPTADPAELGRLAGMARFDRTSLDRLRQMAAHYIFDPLAQVALGETLMEANLYVEAIGPLGRARMFLPDDKQIAYSYGKALLESGRHEDSIVPLQLSLGSTEVQTGMPESMLARALYFAGRFHEAIALAEMASRLDRDLRLPPFILGKCFHRLGQYDKALQALKLSARGNRADGSTYEAMGFLFMDQNKYSWAEGAFKMASHWNPDLGAPYLYRAACLERLGDIATARACLQTYIGAAAQKYESDSALEQSLRIRLGI